MKKGNVWQCKCGHIEYDKDVPEDCQKCFRVGKFHPIPEDMIEEKAEEEILSMNPEDYEDKYDIEEDFE